MVQQPWNSLGSRAEGPVSARDPSLRTEALSFSPEDRATSVHREGTASLSREEMVYVWGRRKGERGSDGGGYGCSVGDAHPQGPGSEVG